MRRLLCQAVLVAAAVLSLTASAQAATLVVATAADSSTANPPVGSCSIFPCALREAVTDANDEPSHPGPDTIQVPPGTYNLATFDALPTITSDITIEGTGGANVTTITGADTAAASSPKGGVFTVNTANGKLTLRGVTISGNRLTGTAANGGGAIAAVGGTVVLNGSVVRGNRTEAASSYVGSGGIGASGGTKLTLIDSAVEGNVFAGTSSGGVGATAGGIVSDSGGATQILRSSISRNRGDLASSTQVTVVGGLNLNTSGPTVSIADSTISQNSVTGGNAPFRTAGAIISGGFPSVALTNVTITDNTTSGSGSLVVGNLTIASVTGASVTNSIVAGGRPQNCVLLSATIASGGGNVEDANSCTFTGPGDVFNTPPRLAALQFAGGLGLSQEPLADSPALNRGRTAFCSASDQNGVARPQGAGCDSGAVETAAAPVNTALPSISGTAASGQTLTCSPGTFSENPTLAFAWLSDGAVVGSGATLVVGAAQLDTAIQCRVTATNLKGSTVATSAAVVPPKPPVVTPPAAPVNTVRPSFAGTLRTGQKLTCAQGTFSNASSFAVAWLRNGARVASGTTYTLVAADAGTAVQCQVTATGAGGSVVAESAPGVAAKACIVPALSGKTLAAAKKALKKANCATGKTKTRTSSKKAGTVIASSPAKGNNLAAGTKVALTVAKK